MDSTALTVVAVAVAALGAAAVVVVARRTDGPLRVRSLVLPAGAVLGGAFIASVPVRLLARSSPVFSGLHLGYLVFAIALPLVGLAVAVAAVVRGARWPVWVVVVALLVPAPVSWYATHVAPYRLRVVRGDARLPPERAGSDPIRIGVLSDIQTSHITGYEQRAVTTLLGLKPDIILVPGDLFQGSAGEFRKELPAFRRLLGRLEAPGGVFAVRGDTDTGRNLDELVAGTDVRILDYEVAAVRVGDRTVRIGGSKLLWAPAPAVELRRELLASDPSDVRILLAHRPDIALLLPPDSGIDLTVAGHTHGGQVALPGVGPVVTFSRVSRSVAAGGLHEVGGNELFVSSGVGMARLDAPQVRFLTRPSVGLVVLR
jgi:hypothetical protein